MHHENHLILKNRRYYKIYFILILFIIIGCVLSLGVGTVNIKPYYIVKMFMSRIPAVGSKVIKDWSMIEESIIFQIRLPRIILSFIVGAELSAAGVLYQGVFRNPMADPYIIGASAGASLGATIAIMLFSQIKIFGISPISIFSFIGSIVTVFVVYQISSIKGRTYSFTLLLSGVAISSFISALVSFLMYFSDQKLHQIYFWLLGSFSFQGWEEVLLNLPYGLIGFILGLLTLRSLNLMQLGENTAFFSGVDTERLKKICLISASLLTASAVAVSGIIGFVGLIIPHITRLITGPDNRVTFYVSAMVGGLYLTIVDTISRVIIQPTELPVGILTAIFGGPFFVYLLLKKKGEYGF